MLTPRLTIRVGEKAPFKHASGVLTNNNLREIATMLLEEVKPSAGDQLRFAVTDAANPSTAADWKRAAGPIAHAVDDYFKTWTVEYAGARQAYEVTQYAPHASGQRTAEFTTADGFKIQISHSDEDRNDDVLVAARQLADVDRVLRQLLRDNTRLKAEALVLRETVRTKVPPTRPARLLGPGCVRFTERGELWVLNKRETGWSSFGYVVDGWDDLFRRFDVRVTSHGADEHGAYWIVEPNGSAP